jgi:hypothetical protein
MSGLVDNPNVRNIVRVWQTVGANAPHGKWCMLGARMGAQFGRQFRDTDAIRAINDMAWLRAEFEQVHAKGPSAVPPAI